ncbi:hypothetical protein AeNC1_015758 [Aphanomyces euteiches]|nr:hypothetical protein AeNC1_015758 [Aphanomyces euteiches]
MGKVTSDEGKQDMKRGAAEPEREDKEVKEREKPKADVTEIVEEADLADKTEGKPSVPLIPVATTGPFPMIQDLTLDAHGYPQALSTCKVHESLFMLKAREMAMGDLWFAKTRQDCAEKWNPLVKTSGLLTECGTGHRMDFGDCQCAQSPRPVGQSNGPFQDLHDIEILADIQLQGKKLGVAVRSDGIVSKRERRGVFVAVCPCVFHFKRGNNDYEDRPTPRTFAQWTNRLANYVEFRWNTLTRPIRSEGFQRLAQVCVLNAAAVTRKLPTLEAPYRLLPSTAIDKDGIPVRPDCSAFSLDEKRKRRRSHAVMEWSQRPRRHQLSWLRSYQVVRGRRVDLHLLEWLLKIGLWCWHTELQGQNRELQAQNQEMRDRLVTLEKHVANYPREDLLRELRRENEATATQLEEMTRHVDSLWRWRKEWKSTDRRDSA